MAKKDGKRVGTRKKSSVRRPSTVSAKTVSLAAHLRRIEATASKRVADGAERGACLVTDPQTGQNQCIRTDAATCKTLKGVFLGGPCGGGR